MKKDFEKYFVELQLDYNKLMKSMDKINEQAKDGLITDDQRELFAKYFDKVKTNYDRVSYMRYLLHKPPKFIQLLLDRNLKHKLEKELEYYKDNDADQESVLKENKESLDNIDTIISEASE